LNVKIEPLDWNEWKGKDHFSFDIEINKGGTDSFGNNHQFAETSQINAYHDKIFRNNQGC